jgi:limonene-1,2-epoxide hydrolase
MNRFAGAIALALTLAISAPAKAADTDASRIAVAKEMIAAWKAADWKKVGDLFAENGVLRSMMLPEATVGRQAIYERIAALGKGAPGGVTLDVVHMGVILQRQARRRAGGGRAGYPGRQGPGVA